MAVKKGFNIRAVLGLETKGFSKGLKGASGRMTAFQKSLRTTNDVLRGLQFTAVGVTAAGAFTRAFTVVKDFETQMARVKVITQATDGELNRITETARNIGATTRFSATEAASGFQYLGMAGLSANESMKVILPTMNLAGAAMIDVGRSADILTNVMAGFGLGVGEATRVADVFAQASRSSNQTVEELYEGVVKIAPAYRNLGLSIEEATRDMSLLANAGVKAGESGTALAGALSRLLRNVPMVTKALNEMGVTITETDIRNEGLVGVLSRTRDAGISAAQMAQILGLHWKTAGALIALSDEQIQSMTKSISDSEGAAKQMSEEGVGKLDLSIKLLISALDELWISLSEGSGIISGLIDSITSVVRWFASMNNGMKLFQVALVASAFKVKKLNTFMRALSISFRRYGIQAVTSAKSVATFSRSLKAAIGPIGLALLAIEGLTLAYTNFGKESTARSGDIKKNITDHFDDLKRGYSEFNELSDKALAKEGKTIISNIKQLEAKIKSEKSIRSEFSDEQLATAEKELETLKEQKNTIIGITKERLKSRKKKKEDLKKSEIAESAEEDKKRLKELKDKYKELSKEISSLNGLTDQLTSPFADRFLIELDEASKRVDRFGRSLKGMALVSSAVGEMVKKDFEGIDTTNLDPNTDSVFSKYVRDAERAKIANEALKPDWEFIGAKFTSLKTYGDAFGNSIDALSQGMQGFAEEGSDSFKQFGQDAANVARDLIKQQIAVGVANVIRGAMGTGIAGLLLAPIAAGAASTLFNQLVPKFATGGIVPGGSITGDKVPAMLNSREMVINTSDQNKLWKFIKSGSQDGNGSQYEFKLKGDTLIAAINNANRKNRSIK